MACRIVVADDSRDSAEILKVRLQMAGHQVWIADDGREALKLIQQFEPHVVLLDVCMPEIDGIEVARHVRASSGDNHAVLIAITAWDAPRDMERLKAAGFDHYFRKPIDIDAVSDVCAGFDGETNL